jgi:hypothetical protein
MNEREAISAAGHFPSLYYCALGSPTGIARARVFRAHDGALVTQPVLTVPAVS